MAAHGFDSTFDLVERTIAAVDNPRDPEQVDVLKERVTELLAARVREEVVGEGDLRKDFAFERIDGSIASLRVLRLQALQVGAAPGFVEIIDLVISTAEAARAVAPRRAAQAVQAGSRRSAWATAEVNQTYQTLPEFLRDI